MTDFKQEILTYQPMCQQEEQDKRQMVDYMKLFEDLLTRENTIAHFTSSGFIVNRQRTKTLFVHHKIYNAWCWTGGHVDGVTNFQEVALKEAREETGLETLQLLSPEIASLDILPVIGHFKNQRWVSAHQHLSVAYLLEADETAPLRQNRVETNGLKWLAFEEIAEVSGEPEMLPIYQKLLTFLERLK